MKRFHVHVHVDDLARNVAFYSAMFGTQPARVEADYAKWMLDEPAVNFAISTRGSGHLGVDHLGIQVDNEEDLSAMKAQAQAADMALIDAGATSCCYARSNKHWIVDPQPNLHQRLQKILQPSPVTATSPSLISTTPSTGTSAPAKP